MSAQSQVRFVVAYNLISPVDSQLLARDVSPARAIEIAEDAEQTNLYTGQGTVLYLCRTIEPAEDAADFAFALAENQRSTIFEIVKILRVFPRIEGALAPGIYQFYPQELQYYEIKDFAALSRFWNNDPNFDFETKKIVCCADGIAVFDLHEQVRSKSNDNRHDARFAERLPLDYFDVFCPLCNARVVTHQAGEEYLQCEIIETPCRHFVSNLVCIGDSFIPEELDDLNRRYELRRGKLHFAVADDEWQEAIIQALSRTERESFWASNNDSDYRTRQIFVP